eukprot:gnl/TRDRNA2_/TRDRNA2_38323_c0_seq1.p1 gnl/TRDRNA2_/TRDRNA2_38323_c0~~gnl/TRDRNA2_/TRDRNA2_38323_c0_seq1.p1  ORF type:complete len:307 (+),score=66.49 gnl/TRDRNA2_/TRDRNA2_38323_c0_seq1:115-1035(+)
MSFLMNNSLGFAGGVISTTRSMKDWDGAGNEEQRKSRCDSRRGARRGNLMSDFTVKHHAPDFSPKKRPMSACSSASSIGAFEEKRPPIVLCRGPMASRLKGGDDVKFDDWLKDRAETIFSHLDKKETGLLSLEDLKQSFIELHAKDPTLRMTDKTFKQYCNNLFPKCTEMIDLQQFIMFHRVVWENQPLTVRRAHSKLREVQDADSLARAAFDKYDKDRSGFLDLSELPRVLEDLGFELDVEYFEEKKMEAFIKKNFKDSDKNSDGRMSYHEFVDFQNNFIETKELADDLHTEFADAFKGGFQFRK